MNRILSIVVVIMAFAGLSSAATQYPVVKSFTNSCVYTNSRTYLQTIVRVSVSTPTVTSNQVTMKYTQGIATNTGFTMAGTTNFRVALWPQATSEIAVVLYSGDRILVSQTYTGRSYATFDVLETINSTNEGGGISVAATSDYAFVMYDPVISNWTAAYASRFVTNWSVTPRTNFYPQQLVKYNGNVYYARTRIYAIDTNYPGYTSGTNLVYPVPGVHDQWGEFVEAGADGATGSTGQQGASGAGNIQYYGLWNNATEYHTNTNTWVYWTSPILAVYQAILPSTNKQPDLETAHWVRILGASNGLNAAVMTGLVFRSDWAAGTYCSNDLVKYGGSGWLVTNGCTTATPGGTNWYELFEKGDQGNQGPAGEDGDQLNVYYQYTLAFSNGVWLNNPDPFTNKFAYLHSVTNGTNRYAWTFLPYTNRYVVNRTNVDGGPYFVSNDYALATTWWRLDLLTNSGGGGSVTFTGGWSSVYTDGSTNAKYLALGPSGTLYVAMGAAADPQFQTLAQRNIALETQRIADSNALFALAVAYSNALNAQAVANSNTLAAAIIAGQAATLTNVYNYRIAQADEWNFDFYDTNACPVTWATNANRRLPVRAMDDTTAEPIGPLRWLMPEAYNSNIAIRFYYTIYPSVSGQVAMVVQHRQEPSQTWVYTTGAAVTAYGTLDTNQTFSIDFSPAWTSGVPTEIRAYRHVTATGDTTGDVYFVSGGVRWGERQQ